MPDATERETLACTITFATEQGYRQRGPPPRYLPRRSPLLSAREDSDAVEDAHRACPGLIHEELAGMLAGRWEGTGRCTECPTLPGLWTPGPQIRRPDGREPSTRLPG